MNFDPIADRYDQTRALPPGVPDLIRDRIVTATGAGPDTRFLEPGIGTGRIALPFILAGYQYTGVDISAKMMAKLEEKVADAPHRLTLCEGDITALPFPDASFDVVIIVHVLHLVPAWKEALVEIRRVTVPEGWLVLAGNTGPGAQPADRFREHWYAYVRERGAPVHRRHNQLADIEAELTAQNCMMHQFVVAQWENQIRPIDVLESLRRRTWSQTWNVPDDLLEDAHQHVLTRAKGEYGDLETPLASPEEFVVTLARWPSTAP